MPNEKIRRYARVRGVALWRVAERLGISEPTMTRMLHKEIDDTETAKILTIIDTISEELRCL